MYFQTLQILGFTFFLCGLFQIRAISWYTSDFYSGGQPGVVGMLRGSAICTEQAWVSHRPAYYSLPLLACHLRVAEPSR